MTTAILSAESARNWAAEPRGGLDFDFADRDALNVQPEWNADTSTERDQLDGRRDSLVVGRGERIVGVAQIVRDPARDGDAEPLQELQRLHRATDREREDDRHRFQVVRDALVAIVGDEVLRGVDVVDDLGDEERASCSLFLEQPEVLPARARVPLGDRDTAERQLRPTSV